MFIETTSQPPARLGEAEEVIDRAISDERLVGVVVLVARDGQIILRKAAGYADRESRRRMDVDAIFRFASLTKPIVTAAALSLIERKEVELGDPVTRWIPRFRPKLSDGAEPVITIRHLLTHITLMWIERSWDNQSWRSLTSRFPAKSVRMSANTSKAFRASSSVIE